MFDYFRFNPASFEANLQYELFGLLLGLAIYNNVILDVRFPNIVYQKLLCEDEKGILPNPTMEDFIDVDPEQAKPLLQILEYDGDDVEDTFCLEFW